MAYDLMWLLKHYQYQIIDWVCSDDTLTSEEIEYLREWEVSIIKAIALL